VLGTDAYARAQRVDEARLAELRAWQETSVSTDFPTLDPASLLGEWAFGRSRRSASDVERITNYVPRSPRGLSLRARLGYTFTAIAAAEAARRALNGKARPGSQTSAGLFGDSFAETTRR
jgi:hypothetical protein